MNPDPASHLLAPVGSQTIREAAEMHADLRAALLHGAVLLDCSAVTETDLTFVQLILAARRGAVAAGHSFAVREPIPAALADVLRRGGFQLGNAAHGATDPASWCSSGAPA